jgi:spermidine/putrescine transport system ATP-binding protein
MSTTAEQSRPPAIALEHLERHYGELTAVAGIDLVIADGEFFSLIGPSGCGKTTTLRIVAGLETPSGGKVSVRGQDVTDVPAFKRPVNTVFQHYALFPHLNVFENVAFGLKERKVSRRDTARRVTEMLELVGLTGREKARPKQLSGGQQQRVALARSLVLEPAVLLLDEPLGALDLKLRKQMQMVLKQIQREVGITFVYVTHDQEEAFSMSDRVAIMHKGKIEQIGDPVDTYRRPQTLFVADFVGASNRFEARVVERLGTGSYRADMGTLGTLDVPGVAGLAVGDQVVAVVRPEAIRTAPGFGDAVLDGTVTDVSFMGPQTQYVVDAGGLGTAAMLSPADDDDLLHSGAAQQFRFAARSAWLVAADPGPVDDAQ